MPLLYRYKRPVLALSGREQLLSFARQHISHTVRDIHTEYCFYIETETPLENEDLRILRWLLSETFAPEHFSEKSFLSDTLYPKTQASYIEVGPRLNFTTAWSTNAVSVCRSCGLASIIRIERSRRYRITAEEPLNDKQIEQFARGLHDRMTECLYPFQLTSFETGAQPEPVFTVPLAEQGRSALEKINTDMGLGLDDWDIDYYNDLFMKQVGRDPTNVECFDLGQSNSEHSRHWFFKGRLIIDGSEMKDTLLRIIQQTLEHNPGNSVIAFKDNSSAIRGYEIETIVPDIPGHMSRFRQQSLTCNIIFTAETHNFPSGVAPFPGAETGTGGRIRDVQATGRGALVIAGTAAYCVGNLMIPDYPLPWEDTGFSYPSNLASPLAIEIEASNGASDYGNKFGEPVIQGFTRSFGLRLPDQERREWIKPIMFTGGIGQMKAEHTDKHMPEKGMLVTKIGGPAYRIGMGGGAASSMIQGENIAELDFNAVQRGDAEMEQKMNRIIRACVEMGDRNPIISIHDQGAGGNCNVVKEIIYPAGARIELRKIQLGDDTLSVLEIWGAEYQEQNALLITSDRADEFLDVCRREKVPCAFIGEITGNGFIILYDEIDNSTPVNLSLDKVLGDMPQKTFILERVERSRTPVLFPTGLTVRNALERVLKLISVGSKRFLTNKVDRSVTGLIARQQCCGPLQLTVSDVAVIAQSHFGVTGAAIAIGEQPVKSLINPAAMARMSVGEAVTNIIWARIRAIEDIKCSANWMWAPKMPGEGADLYDAAIALRDVMIALGIAVDGGKDSLSMAAKVTGLNGETEIAKSPGTLVISAYATCPDITKVITPDVKKPGESRLLLISLSDGKNRLGGSALAQCYGQVGNESPDIERPELLKKTFATVQQFISDDLILAGHDRSDGGLITTLLEMAFAGNCGLEIDIQNKESGIQDQNMNKGLSDEISALSVLFSEEIGLVIEYLPRYEDRLTSTLKHAGIPYELIGRTVEEKRISMRVQGQAVLNEDMRLLRSFWEETSYQIERLQAHPDCADEEKNNVYDQREPQFHVSFEPEQTSQAYMGEKDKPNIAIIREEGSNGDREMASAFYAAGCEPWDVTMTDLLDEKSTLDHFNGVVFVGGFSYADVLDSAKGWAGVIRFNKRLWQQFRNFYTRSDTFSLGICNGCQLMAYLGWIPWQDINDAAQPRFIRNISSRFESRFSAVRILKSPAVMLRGMEDSVLGVWVAHGEGRVYFPDENIKKQVLERGLAPVRYVDDTGKLTERYPFNPNGSPDGITALCSPDGKHLAMMPHPERTFLTWQWAWMPDELQQNHPASPWLKMFQNAREWCDARRTD